MKGLLFGFALLGLCFLSGSSPASATVEPTTTATQHATDDAIELQCVPRDQCCRVCSRGCACGDSCIQCSRDCQQPAGCACNASDICR